MLSLLGSTLFLPLAVVYLLTAAVLGVSVFRRYGAGPKHETRREVFGKNSQASRE